MRLNGGKNAYDIREPFHSSAAQNHKIIIQSFKKAPTKKREVLKMEKKELTLNERITLLTDLNRPLEG